MNAGAIESLRYFREEQFEKFGEEGGEKFLEEAVVIHGRNSMRPIAFRIIANFKVVDLTTICLLHSLDRP